MICPICHGHKLLKGEHRWYCPRCFHVFTRIPIYGKNPPLFKNTWDDATRNIGSYLQDIG